MLLKSCQKNSKYNSECLNIYCIMNGGVKWPNNGDGVEIDDALLNYTRKTIMPISTYKQDAIVAIVKSIEQYKKAIGDLEKKLSEVLATNKSDIDKIENLNKIIADGKILLDNAHKTINEMKSDFDMCMKRENDFKLLIDKYKYDLSAILSALKSEEEDYDDYDEDDYF